MRQSIAVIMLLTLLLGLAAPTAAQDASPEAESSPLADLGLAELRVTGTDAGLEMETAVPVGSIPG